MNTRSSNDIPGRVNDAEPKIAEISDTRAKEKEPKEKIAIRLPFPHRQINQKMEHQFTKFMDVVKNLEVTIPFTDLITQVPAYAKFLKDIITRKRSLNTSETVAFTEECSQILQGRSPPKLNDPGSFSITCAIGSVTIDKALCDLGASVSVMPYSICKQLNMGELKCTSMTLQMADRSIKRPLGIIEDVPVKIGKFFIPVDFVVLDMAEDAQIPIILGRPFLHTAGAVIDVKHGSLTLEVAGEKITFNLSRSLKQPMLEESLCSVDIIDDVVEEVWHDSLLRDPLAALRCFDPSAGDTDEMSTVKVSSGTTEGGPIIDKKASAPPGNGKQLEPCVKNWVDVRRTPPKKQKKVQSLPLNYYPVMNIAENQVSDLREEFAVAEFRLLEMEKMMKPPDAEEFGFSWFGGVFG